MLIRILLIFCLSVLCITAHAQPLAVTDVDSVLRLNSVQLVWEDRSHQLTVDPVILKQDENLLDGTQAGRLDFGFNNATWWLSIAVHFAHSTDRYLVLDFSKYC